MMIVTPPLDMSELAVAVWRLGPVGRKHDGFLAPTGDPYVTITSGGIKAEAEPDRNGSFSTIEAAIASFWKHLTAYLDGRKGVIYWRKVPALSEDVERHPVKVRRCRLYRIRCRVLKSEKPDLGPDADLSYPKGKEAVA